jgi:hypothetical protein
MFNWSFILIQILLIIFHFSGKSQLSSGNLKILPEIHVSMEEWEIFQQINEYRAEKRLAPVPLSGSLTYVAQQHAMDLAENYHTSGRCNLHSWSAKGNWTSCCYTEDHKRASCMWNKPRELTNYSGDGYEIAYWTNEPLDPTEFAKKALLKWKNSYEHNSVIINSHEWHRLDWKAMGVGYYKGYMVVWFGAEPDNDTQIRSADR